ncbi:MAG: hypothetical protein ACOYK9_00850 [Chlamydiia bacterium]
MRILSLEGAPCRGLGQIEIIKKISEIRSTNFSSDFDVYLGSSWGAVLALCLAHGVPLEEIEEAFESAQKYVNSKFNQVLSLFVPRMCPKRVVKPFHKFFENLLFGGLKKRVICHGYDFSYKKIVTFDSANPRDRDLNVMDLVSKLTFAPSVFKPHLDTSVIDVTLATRSPLFYSLVQFYQEWKRENIHILHIGIGQKKVEGSKVRKLFQRGWIHWLFSKRIFDEIESIGRSYQDFLVETVKNSLFFPSLKLTCVDPLIDSGLDFSFMGDVSLTPEKIRKEVTGWMEEVPIDHLES